MPAAFTRSLYLPDAADTARLGAWLGDRMGAGDTLLLEGGIGAGKTHLARSLIQSRLARCGAVEDVPSPTYTLVQTYLAGTLEIWHADLYRLGDPGELIELGLDAALDEALCLIEWPDRMGADRPAQALTLALAPEGAGRRVTLSGPATWETRLADLKAETLDA